MKNRSILLMDDNPQDEMLIMRPGIYRLVNNAPSGG